MKERLAKIEAYGKAHWKELLALTLAAIPALFLVFHKGTQKAAASAISYIPATFGGGAGPGGDPGTAGIPVTNPPASAPSPAATPAPSPAPSPAAAVQNPIDIVRAVAANVAFYVTNPSSDAINQMIDSSTAPGAPRGVIAQQGGVDYLQNGFVLPTYTPPPSVNGSNPITSPQLPSTSLADVAAAAANKTKAQA